MTYAQSHQIGPTAYAPPQKKKKKKSYKVS